MPTFNTVYEFIAGPVLWGAFSLFFGGLAFRLMHLYRLSRKKDQIFYNHVDFGWGVKSIVHWIIPWASASMRLAPVFTFIAFVFHLLLLAVPIFLSAHNILWDEAFGVRLWSLPDGLADAMTLVVLGAGIYLFGRRIKRPEVRILTEAGDYFLLLLTLLPFISGFLAFHQWGPYKALILLHILSGEALLVLIPFTKLGHMVLFFFTRMFIGFEMGSRRGARSW